MRRAVILIALPLVLAGTGAGAWLYVHRDPDPKATEAEAIFHRYCIDCHNEIDYSGSMSLEHKDIRQVATDAETWEHVVRKLKTGMMPPAGEPRPPRKTLDALVANLESRLDRAGSKNPLLVRTALRRLNRTEYGNAIRDLLDLDVDPATLLPLDDSSEGFDNIATALNVSPSLVDAYISSAMKISRRAIGDATTPESQTSYSAPPDLAQDTHLDGFPLGTRGGLEVEHNFPLDAEYEIRVRRGFGFGFASRLDLTIDGTPVPAGGRGSIHIPVTAGPHTLAATLVDTNHSTGVDDVYGKFRKSGGVQSIEIDGPLNPTGVGDTPSRRRILICSPETQAEETPCAEQIVKTLASRAFRRPVSIEDLGPVMDFYAAGRAEGGFEDGIQQAVARILVDPRFVYRFEPEPAALAPGEAFRIDDYSLATRLSFFLWSSIPDDALLDLAAAGRLHEPDVLKAQVKRMLADSKADALVDNFAAQWLFLRELDSVTPNSDAFDGNLRESMRSETKMLFSTIMRENLSVVRLLDADFTFVDERLAKHYGIEDVHGSYFRRVAIPEDSPRRGLLGQASILTVTSVTSRTSPVIRGEWVLENLLGSPAPTPPPNVNTTLEGDNGVAVATTVRERLEAHRANPTCASCHAIMDPVGFTLENFDLIGAWRDADQGNPIDTQGALADGTVVDGPAALREALLSRSDAFVTTAVEKLMTYALGRRLEYFDMPAIRAIVRQADKDDDRFASLVEGVVSSDAFQTGVKGGDD